MKKIILIMCLFLICGAAFAQSVFKDVPAGHWAYKDVARLCELGVITGYPDGAFDGTNTLTRYEFAAAVAKVLPLIKDDETLTLATMYDLEKLLPAAEAADGPRDETDLSAYLTADALAAVRRLCDEFEIELLEFNYNQNDFRDGLEALSKRLEAAKKEQEKITLKGHAVFYADGIFSGDSQIMDADDYPVSNSQRKQSFFKDVQLDLDAKINDNLTLVTTTLLGDYLAKTAMDEEVYDTLSDVTPYYFYLSQQEPWGNVRVGRQPFQINQYIFNHEDPNMFIEIPRLWDADFASEGITWKGELGAFDGRAWLLRPVYDWDDPVLEGRYYVPFRIRSKITAMGGGELGYTFPGGIRLSALYTDLLGERKDKEDLLPYGKTRYTPFSDNTKYYGGSLKIPIGK
ncbi:MAG: S-layer homology domain-containing protein [Abditibacteriota bacterium]|nr:S-layer homology domain-containing protein [Abditibacteriota bacterium]